MKQGLLKKGVTTFIIDESWDNTDTYTEEHTNSLRNGLGELAGQ